MDYLEDLKRIISISSKYKGSTIDTFIPLINLYFDENVAKEINKILDDHNYIGIFSTNDTGTNKDNIAIMALIKDKTGQCFFVIMIQSIELFSDDSVYRIGEISEKEYSALLLHQPPKVKT